MNENERIKHHKIIQDILDNYLGFMSGKIIKGPGREQQRYIRVDYLAQTEGVLPAGGKTITLPFEHLIPYAYHIIEYKSFWQVLNENTFREYVGRALVLENADPKEKYLDQLTLTILTSRKPENLIKSGLYAIEQVNEWKYISRCFPKLNISILVLREMRGKKEGEALALLQILDTEGWPSVFSQDLENTEVLRNIGLEIGKEVYMNLVAELKKEGKKEVAKNLLRDGLEIPRISRATGLSQEEIIALKQELEEKAIE